MSPTSTPGAAQLEADRDMRELRDQFAMRALPFCCIEAVKEFAHVKSTHFDAVNHAREACKRAYVIADAMIKARQ